MTGLELFVLGRKLMKLAEVVLPQGQLGPSVRSVAIDIGSHPESSISEITERTGFPQSHVSASVAKLRGLGVVETEADPSDRRRTLVRMAPAFVRRMVQRAPDPIDETIARVLGSDYEDELAEVLAALEFLGERLTPKVWARMHAEATS